MAGITGESACAGPSRTEVVTSGEGAVFVDASGRRRSWLRSAGWVVAVSCVCFGTALVALVSGGDSAAPWLPLPHGVRKHKDVSAEGDASRVQEGPTGSPSPSPVGPGDASASPREVSGGGVPAPTGSPAGTQRAGAVGSAVRPSQPGASAAPSPSAVPPSATASATPPGVAPATPAAGASGSPTASPSGTPGEATASPSPDPSGPATAETASAGNPFARVRVTGLPAFG
ncbi:hypothetical protein [Streptomyces sp. NBC_00358]|jgi:Predicted membrane protein|uniref:hypothetical protein n=1 Tax=Streptomyces sp. NBC_00358 TaxID=2975725 RepID=UPI002E25C492